MTITYLKGDATLPQGNQPRIITHIVNDFGRWGAGFVLSISAQWPWIRDIYQAWFNPDEDILDSVYQSGSPGLGQIQIVDTYELANQGQLICNMMAQHGLRCRSNPVPLKYVSLEACLNKLHHFILQQKTVLYQVHMPRIGCGLAGGSWSEIAKIVERTLRYIPVFVYDLE